MKKLCLLLIFVAFYAARSSAQSCICLAGPNTMCQGEVASFYLASGSASSYTWSVSSNLQILSGQGTTGITVSATSPYTTGYGTITLQLGDPSCGVSLTYQTLLLDQFPATISGTDVCAGLSSTFSVTSASAVSYSWSTTPNLTITGGAGTSSITVAATPPALVGGTGTVTVVVTNSAGCTVTLTYNATITPFIDASGFHIEAGPIVPGPGYCASGIYNFHVIQDVRGIIPTSYIWSYTTPSSPTPTVLTTSYVDNLGFVFPDLPLPSPATATIYCQPVNNCGGYGPAMSITETYDDCTPPHGKILTGDGSPIGGFSIFPNPAGDAVKITSTTQPAGNKTNATQSVNNAQAFDYKVFDETGKLLKSGKSTGANATIDTHDLPSKIYILNIIASDGTITKKSIIIQHQ